MPRIITKLTILILLLNCQEILGQRQVGVYNIDSLKVNVNLFKWINYEKENFLDYLKLKNQAKQKEYDSFIQDIQNIRVPEAFLLVYEDSFKKVNADFLAYFSQLEELFVEYERGLQAFLDSHLAENLELIQSDRLDLIVEEKQLLYYNSKTTLKKNITSQLIRRLNAQPESDFLLNKWMDFKIYWRSRNLMKLNH